MFKAVIKLLALLIAVGLPSSAALRAGTQSSTSGTLASSATCSVGGTDGVDLLPPPHVACTDAGQALTENVTDVVGLGLPAVSV